MIGQGRKCAAHAAAADAAVAGICCGGRGAVWRQLQHSRAHSCRERCPVGAGGEGHRVLPNAVGQHK
eukprot:1161944-Pelagomonas_calceolata.AAC.15